MASPSSAKVLVRAVTRVPKTPFPKNTLLLRKPIQRGAPLPPSEPSPQTIDYGQYIFFYNHIRTNQVVYSLTRHLNNAASLAQLTFLGKKTVPSRLRKDLWDPFCMVYFPKPHAGLAAFRKLREFRVLHEMNYPLDLVKETEGKWKGSLMPKKRRGKVLMDQKANSVADLAAVLQLQEEGPSEARIWNAKIRRDRVKHLRNRDGEDNVRKAPLDVVREMKGVEGVEVRWANMLDAEYAKAWPEGVFHGGLEKSRYTAAFPTVEIIEEEEGVNDELLGDKGDGEIGRGGDVR